MAIPGQRFQTAPIVVDEMRELEFLHYRAFSMRAFFLCAHAQVILWDTKVKQTDRFGEPENPNVFAITVDKSAIVCAGNHETVV